MIWYSRDENGIETPLTVSGGQTIQVNEMPAASSDYVGIVCQYIGATTANYIHNYFYECIEDTSTNPATYSWVPTNVQAGEDNVVQSDWNQDNPTADDYIKNKPNLTEHSTIIPTVRTKTKASIGVSGVGVAVDVTWNGLTSFDGNNVWTDGTDIYYSSTSNQYVLNKSTSTWSVKTWNGLTSFDGNNVWTDGTDIYYSSTSNQYVLNKSTSTWSAKTWSGLTSFNGKNVWIDGTNTYYSSGSTQYVLNKTASTWSTKSWDGLSGFNGEDVWTDGTDIYYSSNLNQYVLDKSASKWTGKIWVEGSTLYGNPYFNGSNFWTDGTDIYYSSASNQYILNKFTSKLTTKTWSGLTSFNGKNVWTDGMDIYYSYNGTNKKIITSMLFVS